MGLWKTALLWEGLVVACQRTLSGTLASPVTPLIHDASPPLFRGDTTFPWGSPNAMLSDKELVQVDSEIRSLLSVERGHGTVCSDRMPVAKGRPEEASWEVCMDWLPGNCLVYSLGRGRLANVEAALGRQQWGCEVHSIVGQRGLDRSAAVFADLYVNDVHLHQGRCEQWRAVRLQNHHELVAINVLKVDCNLCVLDRNVLGDDILNGVDQLLLKIPLGQDEVSARRIDRVALGVIRMVLDAGFLLFFRSNDRGDGAWWGNLTWGSSQNLGFVRPGNVGANAAGLVNGGMCDAPTVVHHECDPVHDPEGMVCADEGLKTEAYCSYDLGPSMCATCSRMRMRDDQHRNAQQNIARTAFTSFQTLMALPRRSDHAPRRPQSATHDPIDASSLDLSLKRVVASLTTIPSHVNALQGVLNGLKSQSYQLDAIYLNLPKVSARLNRTYTIPEYLIQDPDIILNILDEDYGPVTKLVPTLFRETDPSTLIVVVDDDDSLINSRDFVLSLLNSVARRPSAVFGHQGWNVSCMLDYPCARYGNADTHWGNIMFVRQDTDAACRSGFVKEHGLHHCVQKVSSIDHPIPVDVIEGYRGAIYRRAFFDDALIEQLQTPPQNLTMVDDVWISGNLAMRGVDRMIAKDYREGLAAEHLLVQPREYNRDGVRFKPTRTMTDKENADLHADTIHGTVSSFQAANRYGAQYFRQRHAW